MKNPSPGVVTQLLIDWRSGDQEAPNKLMPLVYNELRHIAQKSYQKYGLGGILQPTAIVHEAYLKLVDEKDVEWQNRAHFYAIAANTIRRILIEDYRKRMASKRGGKGATHIAFTGFEASSKPQSVDFLALNEALEKLESLDPQQARIIELRFFGGLNYDEIAEVLGTSRSTIEREWKSAKGWLYSRLSGA